MSSTEPRNFAPDETTPARRITLAMPEVEGERVLFRWSEPDQSPWHKSHQFEVIYPGVPLDAFSAELLIEIFLSLQLRIFGLHSGKVELRLPLAMPRASVEWWCAFNKVANVEVGPLSEGGYSPWAKAPVVSAPRSTAVFFGGGKDSTLARSVLAEVYGEEDVLLVQLVHPFNISAAKRAHLRARQRALMIDPILGETRLDAAIIETDYIAQTTKEGRVALPHTNLYTVMSLPVLLHRGIQRASMSNEMTAYWWRWSSKLERPTVGYSSSRPEAYRGLSAHLAKVAGIQIEYGNTHLPISELLSYKILLERYPRSFSRIVMCVHGDIDQRWCWNCKKCAQYVQLGILNGRRFDDVDYDAFWERSQYIQKVLAVAQGGAPRVTRTGNLPWQAAISHSYHFASFSHTHASLRRDEARRLVPARAHPILDRIANAWGNRTFDELTCVSADAIELAGTEMMRSVAAIYAQHAPLRAGPFRRLPYMNVFVNYDFSRRTDELGRPLQPLHRKR